MKRIRSAMLTGCLAQLVIAIVVAVPASAVADSAIRVLVVRTGHEPACLDPVAVASAITRHSAFPAQVVLQPPARSEGVVEISVAGDTRRLEVRIQGSGRDLHQTIEQTPCESMPDVIAAFVASALAPVSDVPTTAPPLQSAGELAAAVREELGRRGEPLDGLALSLESRADAWDVLLVAPTCTQHGAVDRLARDRGDSVARVADAVTLLIADPSGCADKAKRRRIEHAVLLADALRDYTPKRVRNEHYTPLVWGGIGLVTGSALAIGADSTRSRMLAIGGTSVVVVGAVSAFVLGDDDYAETIGTTSWIFGLGAIVASGVDIDDSVDGDAHDRFHEADLVTGASYGALALWMVIDRTLHRPVSSATLRDIRSRLATPAQRARVTDAELTAYERTYQRRDVALRRLALPLLAGAVVNFSLAAKERNGDEQIYDLYHGGLLALVSVVTLLIPSEVTSYRERLRDLGVEIKLASVPSGSGLSVTGSF